MTDERSTPNPYESLVDRQAKLRDAELLAEVESYKGWGKFQSLLDELTYEFTLDGTDESLGTSEGFGWFGIVRIAPTPTADNVADITFHRVAQAERVEYRTLADGTLEGPGMGPICGAIVNVTNNGAVYVDYFDTEESFAEAWGILEQDYAAWLRCDRCAGDGAVEGVRCDECGEEYSLDQSQRNQQGNDIEVGMEHWGACPGTLVFTRIECPDCNGEGSHDDF